MLGFIVVIVAGTSIWVAYDAHAHGQPWIQWGLTCLVFWIFVFPLYLFERRRFARRGPTPPAGPARRMGKPPGWYADPYKGFGDRWWDGSGWTTRTR